MMKTKTPDNDHNLFRSLKALGLGVLYLLYLSISTVLGLVLFLFQELFHDPCWYRRADRCHRISPTASTMIIDGVWALFAYLSADYLRCVFWMKTQWPETVEGYGSTIMIHAKMLPLVVVLWPIILYCLGWYQRRWRTLVWKILRTVAALLILALSMAGASLLISRELYPRAQIGFMVLMLPLLTTLIRGGRDIVVHLRNRHAPQMTTEW